MKTNIITETMLYFAKFPKREGVLDMFNKGSSDVDGYRQLKEKVEQLPTDCIMEIDDFVFGATLEAVSDRIRKLHNNYLFVDFGEIDFATDRWNRETDSMKMAVSVATRLTEFSSDLVEQALAFDRNLELLNDIRNKMIEDQKTHPWLKNISLSHTIVPLTSPQLQSIGWTMIFAREGFQSMTKQKTNRPY